MLSDSDITQWTDVSAATNHFAPAAASTSKPTLDANGHAVFGAGDSLIATSALFTSAVAELSVFVQVDLNPSTPAGNTLLIGSFINDVAARSFAIYANSNGTFTFSISKNGASTSTDAKTYSIPYTSAAVELGFVFSGGVLTIYKDKSVIAPTKVADASMTSIYANGKAPVIGHNLTSTGALSGSWVPVDGVVKKVKIKLGVMTSEEIAAI